MKDEMQQTLLPAFGNNCRLSRWLQN